MDNYSTADQLEYYPEGDFPGKKHSGWQRLGQVMSLGAYNPDNRELGAENEKITKAKTALKVQGAESAMKAQALRVEAGKNITAFADNLVQFTGMDRGEALKLATEHYQEQSALAAQSAQNEVAKGTAQGKLPFAGEMGRAGAQDFIGAAEANAAQNANAKRYQTARGAVNAPELEGRVTGRAAVSKLQQLANELALDEGAAPFMGDVGRSGAENTLSSNQAATEGNRSTVRRRKAANTLGAPETQGLTDATGAKGDLAKAQGGLATAIDQNSTEALTRALEDPAAKQEYLRNQILIKQLQAAGGVAGAKMQNQQTTADAAGLAGDIQSGLYDTNRRAALDRASTMILPQGGLAVRPDGSRVENPMYFSTIRNIDADGNVKVSGIRGREYQGTADPVAQPIQTPADPNVIRIPRRSLLNPNQQ